MSQDVLDKAKAVRQGEELPLEQVNTWLKEQLPELTGEPKVTQYSGGASNWTYCLSYADREIILRRAPRGKKAKGAHDMGREFRLQQALKPVYEYVPQMLAFCDDSEVLDGDFYIMEKLAGIIPRKNFPRGLELNPALTEQICSNAIDCLVELHQVDYKAANLTHLGKGEGYIERQIYGWSERYANAKTWNVPSAKKVMKWLQQNMPDKERICVTHNDFRLDNLVFDAEYPAKVIGVLDWELATLGDPLMDLGNSLAYWVQEDDDFMGNMIRRQPTHLPGMFSRQQLIDYYLKAMNLEDLDFTFYEVYGLFRLAGIVQQLYQRYYNGQTKNPAFKNFWLFSHYLIWRCNKLIRGKR